MLEPILQVQISASYKDRQVLSDVSFQLLEGEVLGLVGSSGAGKSTIMLSLLGLLPWRGGCVSGSVNFCGRNLLKLAERDLRKVRGKQIATIPQSPLSALNPAVSLQTHFKEAWLAHERPCTSALVDRTEELMNEVNLPYTDEFMRRRPGQISVGQAQRLLIALALLHRPAILIADEPTSALDPVTQTQIVALLRRVTKANRATLLYISHDLISVLQLSDQVAVLDAGRIVEIMPTHQLSDSTHEATKRLIATLPVPLDVLLQYPVAAAC